MLNHIERSRQHLRLTWMLKVMLSRYASPVTAEELTAMMMAQGADLQVTWSRGK